MDSNNYLRVLRLRKVESFLLNKEIATTRRELAAIIGISPGAMSNILLGSTTNGVSNKLIMRVCTSLPFISYKWLRFGEGEMIRDDVPLHPQSTKGLTIDQLRERLCRTQGYKDEEDIYPNGDLLDNLEAKTKRIAALTKSLQDAQELIKQKDAMILELQKTILSYQNTKQ